MMEMAEPMPPLSSSSPSFNSYSAANRLEQIAARVISELAAADAGIDDLFPDIEQVREAAGADEEVAGQSKEGGTEEGHESQSDSDSDDFEFTVVCRDSDASPISADELFSNGQIRPIFPIFNRDLVFHREEDTSSTSADSAMSEVRRASVRMPLRKLMIEDRGPAKSTQPPPSSINHELENLPEGSYCVWTPRSVPPSPERCKKSKSTGSSRRWRFRDLLHRSSSDGKDTFVFLSPGATGRKDGKTETSKVRSGNSNGEAGKSRPPKALEMAPTAGGLPASPHQIYLRNRAISEGDRRRSYLPYRQDIVGFFANVNGLSRTVQPF